MMTKEGWMCTLTQRTGATMFLFLPFKIQGYLIIIPFEIHLTAASPSRRAGNLGSRSP